MSHISAQSPVLPTDLQAAVPAHVRVGALILAAGKGTRMHSETPKVLQRILEEPMLRYLYDAVLPLCPGRTWTVIGHAADQVRAAFPERQNFFIEQKEQLGTGHALQTAAPVLESAKLTHLLVINGDTPLLPQQTLAAFLQTALAADADLAFISLTLDDPAAFGRVVRKNGRVAAIVEAKDYDEALHGPEPREINAGIYCLKLASILPLLDGLTRNNANGEYYITDLAAPAAAQGLTVIGDDRGDAPELMGINTPLELVRSEEIIREAVVLKHLRNNVIIRSASTVRIGPDVAIAPGADICGPAELYGKTVIEPGVKIASHCRIVDAVIAENAQVHSFSHIQEAEIGPASLVGPYARLRPGAVLEEAAHVGNFVEMKKARLGKGAKANHLTYLGDTEVGAKANIGAGTITCNYDGVNKHRTVIGEKAFIGSNSALVAPVEIGADAVVGAGSVITTRVPAGALAVGRGRQRNLPILWNKGKPEKE